VIVDVVGQVKALDVKGGESQLPISTSPVHVLTRADYERLTR
jgi:hypothetical protein